MPIEEKEEMVKTGVAKFVIVVLFTSIMCFVSLIGLGVILKKYIDYDSNFNEHKKKLDNLQDTIVVKNKEINDKISFLNEISLKWSEYEQLTNRIEIITSENMKLEQLRDSIRADIEKLKENYFEIKDSFDATNSQFSVLLGDLDDRKKDIESFVIQKEKLSSSVNELMVKEEKLKIITQDLPQLNEKYEKLKAEYESLKSKLDENNIKLSGLIENVRSEENLIKDKQQYKGKLEEEVKKYEGWKNELNDNVVKLKKEVQLDEAKIKILEEKITNLSAHYVVQTNKLQVVYHQIDTDSVKANEILSQAKANADEIIKEADDQKLKILDNARKKAESIKLEAQNEVLALEQQINELTTKQKDKRKDLNDLQVSFDTLVREKNGVEGSLVQQKRNLDEAQKKLLELEDNYQKVLSDIEVSSNLLKSKLEQLSKIETSLKTMRETEEVLADSINSKQAILRKMLLENKAE